MSPSLGGQQGGRQGAPWRRWGLRPPSRPTFLETFEDRNQT